MAEAAVVAAIIQAIRASGVLIKVEAPVFLRIVNQQDGPIVVRARKGVFRKHWRYLTPYKGLTFYAQSVDPLPLPGRTELFDAKTMWVPG